MATIVNFEFLCTRHKSVYGGHRIEVDYEVQTVTNGIRNVYIVTAEIRGIEVAEPFLNVISYEPKTSNEETLIFEAVKDLFEDYIG